MTLKLIANDADDLKIVSSALQDAIIRIGDIRYDAAQRSVTLRLSRYCHEGRKPARVECGVRIDGVMGLQSRALDQDTSDAFTVLLNMEFTATDAPAGHLDLILAGGGQLRLSVEALDLILADVGDPRLTKSRPAHDDAA